MRPLVLLLFVTSLALAAPVAAQTATPTPAPAAQATPAGAEPTMEPIPSPKPATEDPKIHKIAVQQFLAWQSGSVNRESYADSVNAQLSDETLDNGTKTLARMGPLQAASFQGLSQSHGVQLFVYTMTCQNGSVNMDFALDRAGKISVIFFV